MSNKDDVEAIIENFFGSLNIKKVGKIDTFRHLIKKEDNIDTSKVQGKYTILVRDKNITLKRVGI